MTINFICWCAFSFTVGALLCTWFYRFLIIRWVDAYWKHDRNGECRCWVNDQRLASAVGRTLYRTRRGMTRAEFLDQCARYANREVCAGRLEP